MVQDNEHTVFVGNVSLIDFAGDGADAGAASAVLMIDVIAAPGSDTTSFRFSTLELAIEAPASARFVEHSGRNDYRREVPAPCDPRAWIESGEAARALRIRDDEQSVLLSSAGRTYFVGLTGVGAGTGPLRFSAVTAGGASPGTSDQLDECAFSIGQRIPVALARR